MTVIFIEIPALALTLHLILGSTKRIGPVAVSALVTGFAAGLGEEWFFRGLIQGTCYCWRETTAVVKTRLTDLHTTQGPSLR